MRRNEKLDYILEYFNKTVATFPGREAVDDGVNCYNWQELHLLTQHIALGCGRGKHCREANTGIHGKSADAVAAFLGIITAGCFTSI